MAEAITRINSGSWAIGGGTLLGLGSGFFFLQYSVLAFVGCLIGGIGFGLLVAAFLGSRKLL